MTDNRIQFFADAMGKLIDYHRKENALSYAEAIGVLDMAKMDLYAEMYEEDADENAESWKGAD